MMDRDGLREAVYIKLEATFEDGHFAFSNKVDKMATVAARTNVIMQLAEEYARSVCLEVIGSTEPIPENKYNSMIEFEAHTKGKVRNALRAEQRKRLEDRLQ
jgi:hypothetical protein